LITEVQKLLNQAKFLSDTSYKLEQGKWEYNTQTAWKDAVLRLVGTKYSNKILNHLINSKPTNIEWFRPILAEYIRTISPPPVTKEETKEENLTLNQPNIATEPENKPKDKPEQKTTKSEVNHTTRTKTTRNTRKSS
jgi:hypothetical protein